MTEGKLNNVVTAVEGAVTAIEEARTAIVKLSDAVDEFITVRPALAQALEKAKKDELLLDLEWLSDVYGGMPSDTDLDEMAGVLKGVLAIIKPKPVKAVPVKVKPVSKAKREAM